MQAFSLSAQFARSMLKLPQEWRRWGESKGVGRGRGERGDFFSPPPSPFPSFALAPTVRVTITFYSPQSSTVIKSKMAATTILRTRTRFRLPKIRLHCRLRVTCRRLPGLLPQPPWPESFTTCFTGNYEKLRCMLVPMQDFDNALWRVFLVSSNALNCASLSLNVSDMWDGKRTKYRETSKPTYLMPICIFNHKKWPFLYAHLNKLKRLLCSSGSRGRGSGLRGLYPPQSDVTHVWDWNSLIDRIVHHFLTG